MAVIAGGVFNSGVLANPVPGTHYDYQPVTAPILARAQAMRADCAEFGVALAAAAIQFPGRHPAVTTVLVGVRTPEEIVENLALAQTPIPDELWQQLAQR